MTIVCNLRLIHKGWTNQIIAFIAQLKPGNRNRNAVQIKPIDLITTLHSTLPAVTSIRHPLPKLQFVLSLHQCCSPAALSVHLRAYG
jgi:hypothetical protein